MFSKYSTNATLLMSYLTGAVTGEDEQPVSRDFGEAIYMNDLQEANSAEVRAFVTVY